MSKIEVGMLVEVLFVKNSRYKKDVGTISTVTEIITEHIAYGGHLLYVLAGDTDRNLNNKIMGYAANQLRPINPDSEPADEDFQEDLKRWLDKKVTA